MNKKKFSYLMFLLLTGYMLISLFSFSSCIDSGMKHYAPIEYSEGNDFKTFVTVEEGAPYLSFEYPSYYRLSDQTDTWHDGFAFVVLGGNISEEEFYSGKVKNIEIHIKSIAHGFSNAETSMEHRISLRKWSLQRNYRLREKHKAVVGGIEGWETIITYRERPPPNIGHGTPGGPAFIVARELFFDYQGMTWQIRLYTDADSYEKETKAVFEHLLQTFKFHE